MSTNQTQPQQRTLTGVVVADTMHKTIVVRVDRVKVHPKYKKRYTVSRRYAVHDERNQYRVGDRVTFVECRPLSKTKRWRVIEEAISHPTSPSHVAKTTRDERLRGADKP